MFIFRIIATYPSRLIKQGFLQALIEELGKNRKISCSGSVSYKR